jgi:hypothetical protein
MKFSTILVSAVFAATANIVLAAPVAFSIGGKSTQGVGNTADQYAGHYDGTTPTGAAWFDGGFSPLGNGTLTPASAPLVTPPPGSISGSFQSPFNNTGLADTQSYFSIGGSSNGNGGGSPMTLEFGTAVTEFSFLWGSIDSYNEIEFFDAAQNSLGFVTGAGVLGQSKPSNPTNFEEVVLLNVFADQTVGDSIKYITFASIDQAALEVAFVNPTAIPLPASGFLLIGGLGALYAARRKRKD